MFLRLLLRNNKLFIAPGILICKVPTRSHIKGIITIVFIRKIRINTLDTVLVEQILELLNLRIVVIKEILVSICIDGMLIENNFSVRSKHAHRIIVFNNQIRITTKSNIVTIAHCKVIGAFTTDSNITILARVNCIVGTYSLGNIIVNSDRLRFNHTVLVISNIFISCIRNIQIKPELGFVTIDKVLIMITANCSPFFTFTCHNLHSRNQRQILRTLSAECINILNTNLSLVPCKVMEYNIITFNTHSKRRINKYLICRITCSYVI